MTGFTLGLDEATKVLNAENNIVPRTDQNMNPTSSHHCNAYAIVDF